MESTTSLCEQLAHTDLSEEDTAILLKEATDLNKKLKAELRRIEEKEKGSLKKESQNQQRRTFQKNVPKSSSSSGAFHSGTNMKPKNSFLPPISSTSTNRKSKVSEKEIFNNSPYASADIPNSKAARHRIVTESNMNLRHSSSAGNPSSTSTKAEKDKLHMVSSKTSHSADSFRASRGSKS